MPRAIVVRAKYDAAQTTPENARHWANADLLSAEAAANPEVRRALRSRSRYEIANNSYAKGVVLTLANHTIGTGPRLQMLLPNPKLNQWVEGEVGLWMEGIDSAAKLRTMRMACTGDGESFGLLITNPRLRTPVKLDVRPIEADQIATPFGVLDWSLSDGIEFDEAGNPVYYHILRQHPGDYHVGAMDWGADKVPAASVIHYFRVDRPGQMRGIPEITPALPLYAQLRRFSLAVLAAAETAADFAAVLESQAPASQQEEHFETWDLVRLEQRLATVLPAGWKLGQVRAEQPPTTYPQFKCEILNEIARCLEMPESIVTGNSKGLNYASGRLDHQIYFRSLRIEQSRIEHIILDRLLAAWLQEALLIPGYAPPALRFATKLNHQWFWDGPEHVDPSKEADGQKQRLLNFTTTWAEEYGKRGLDWETQIRQRAKELAVMQSLGLSWPPNGDAGAGSAPDADDDQGEGD